MSMLNKPEFYKDLAFLNATPAEYALQGKLITKIPTMYGLKL